jgi:hypothetical protein
MKCFLGDLPKREDLVMTAIAFALVAPGPEGPSLIERYAAQAGRLPRAERDLLQRWDRSYFALMRVHDVKLDAWIEVHDVLRERTRRVRERAATHDLERGMWFAGFYFELDHRWEFEGTLRAVPTLARIHAVQAALRAYAERGVEPRDATPEQTRRIARAVIEAVHAGSQPPRLVNADGHDILLVTSTLDLPWEEVVSVLRGWPDASVEEDNANLLGPDPVQATGGPAVRAVFAVEQGVVTLFTNSRERHDAVLARWEQATGRPLPIRGEEVQQAPSDRQGTPMIVDSARMDVPPDGDGEALAQQLLDEHDEQWLDLALPALGGLTPHEAVAQGRKAEVWALLADDERGDVLAEVLGLSVPAPDRG